VAVAGSGSSLMLGMNIGVSKSSGGDGLRFETDLS
jgi:hypothetical protein